MGQAIWKYTLSIADEQSITMPVNSEIISVQNQYGNLVVWAVVDDSELAMKDRREFRVIGTGHEITRSLEGWQFIGTVQMANGALVWHVFVDDPLRRTPA